MKSKHVLIKHSYYIGRCQNKCLPIEKMDDNSGRRMQILFHWQHSQKFNAFPKDILHNEFSSIQTPHMTFVNEGERKKAS